MKKLLIVMKSGAQVTVDCDELSTSRSQLSGELTQMSWNTPDGATAKLHSVALSEIAALVALDE